MKQLVNVSVVFSVTAVCSFIAACGGGDSKADPKSVCEQIKKVKDSGSSKVATIGGFTMENCITEKTKDQKEAGDEVFGELYKCLKAAKSEEGIYDCERSMSLAVEGAKLAGEDVEAKIYERCSVMAQNQVVLGRTDDDGAKDWGFDCFDKMKKVHDECEPKKAVKFLACLDREFDPDELITCVKECH